MTVAQATYVVDAAQSLVQMGAHVVATQYAILVGLLILTFWVGWGSGR